MPTERKVVVADDDVASHDEWSAMLSGWGYVVKTAENGDVAFELLRSFEPHILLADLKMPGRSGLELLQEIRDLQLETVPIIISGTGQIPDAVQAMKLGASEYLCKPVDPTLLERIMQKISDHMDVREENLRLRRRLVEVGELGPLFGKSLAMRRIFATIERLADSSASVIISGESGTGKEIAARTIHQLSKRRSAPFIGVNCAAIPQTLLESELFGHERGAFTGADRRREGCFELANHGTLLLDELTEMRPELQAKLLRVLEERKLRRIGSNAEIELDVRVLAAANRNLQQAVRDGTLREDLYYRLNVFTIEMPPLCDRVDDLPLLVESFIQHFAEVNHKTISGVDDECLAALKAHPWPGNVRQLRNIIERATVLCRDSVIRIGDLPAEFKTRAQTEPVFQIRVGTSLDDVERDLLARTIEFTKGNKTHAAELLGITPKTLYNWLDRYAADPRSSVK